MPDWLTLFFDYRNLPLNFLHTVNPAKHNKHLIGVYWQTYAITTGHYVYCYHQFFCWWFLHVGICIQKWLEYCNGWQGVFPCVCQPWKACGPFRKMWNMDVKIIFLKSSTLTHDMHLGHIQRSSSYWIFALWSTEAARERFKLTSPNENLLRMWHQCSLNSCWCWGSWLNVFSGILIL